MDYFLLFSVVLMTCVMFRQALSTSSSPSFNSRQKPDKNRGSSLATSVSGHDNRKADSSSSSKSSRLGSANVNKCLFCGAVHKLDDCIEFCRRPFCERRDFFVRVRVSVWAVQAVTVTR